MFVLYPSAHPSLQPPLHSLKAEKQGFQGAGVDGPCRPESLPAGQRSCHTSPPHLRARAVSITPAGRVGPNTCWCQEKMMFYQAAHETAGFNKSALEGTERSVGENTSRASRCSSGPSRPLLSVYTVTVAMVTAYQVHSNNQHGCRHNSCGL